MKKWIAVLLSVIMVMGLLAGCGDDASTTNPVSGADAANNGTTSTESNTSPTIPADALSILDVAATTEKMDSITELQVKLVDSIGDTLTVAMKSVAGGDVILYEYNAYNNYEYVIEIAGGSLTGYTRTSQEKAFGLMEDTSYVSTMANRIMGLILGLVIDGGNYSSGNYIQSVDASAKTGPAYTFNEWVGNEVAHKFTIDKTTGFIVKYETVEEQPYVEFEVLEINTTNADMPAYK